MFVFNFDERDPQLCKCYPYTPKSILIRLVLPKIVANYSILNFIKEFVEICFLLLRKYLHHILNLASLPSKSKILSGPLQNKFADPALEFALLLGRGADQWQQGRWNQSEAMPNTILEAVAN